MYNPWTGWSITGSWEGHRGYSEGGTDWPLPYGTELRAVASGRLKSNGWAGSAGRRATLHFDQAVGRVKPRSSTLMNGWYIEHDCDMVAFVYQHAKGYLGDGRYEQGALVGFSGASANLDDWGGDVHLHGHGLCEHGGRVDFTKFIGGAATIAADHMMRITQKGSNPMEAYVQAPSGVVVHVFGGGKHNFDSPAEYHAWRDEVMFYKKQGVASNIMTPPALEEVPKLASWAAFQRLCQNFGAPVG